MRKLVCRIRTPSPPNSDPGFAITIKVKILLLFSVLFHTVRIYVLLLKREAEISFEKIIRV
jgi:hypothetical protein